MILTELYGIYFTKQASQSCEVAITVKPIFYIYQYFFFYFLLIDYSLQINLHHPKVVGMCFNMWTFNEYQILILIIHYWFPIAILITQLYQSTILSIWSIFIFIFIIFLLVNMIHMQISTICQIYLCFSIKTMQNSSLYAFVSIQGSKYNS